MKSFSLLLLFLTFMTATVPAQDTTSSFRVKITLQSGNIKTEHYIGVSQNNSIGADTAAALGQFREIQLPPTPPPPFSWDSRIITLPGRSGTFPAGLGTGVSSDFRKFMSNAQIDSFRFDIKGDSLAQPVKVSWPANLSSFAAKWTLDRAGFPADWGPSVDMLLQSGASFTIPARTPGASLSRQFYIIKHGALPAGINTINTIVPNQMELMQNYPNPFNPSTTIRFSVQRSGLTTLAVFNILGETVAELVREVKEAGTYSVEFEAKNLSSGIYLYRLTSGGNSVIRKMLFVK